MSEKGIGSKILGIFVESDEAEAAKRTDASSDSNAEKSPAEIVAELAGRTGGAVAATAPKVPSSAASVPMTPAAPGALPDLNKVFIEAGMDAQELDQVTKAEALLQRLPPGTPLEVRKQIVEASLATFGFSIERILAGANQQRRALEAYFKVNEGATAKAVAEAQAQIQTLTEKIAGLKADIERRKQSLDALGQALNGRKLEVQKVIEFFSPPAAGPKTPA